MPLLHRGGAKTDSAEPSYIVHLPCLANKAHGVVLFFMEMSRCYNVPTDLKQG